MPARIKQRTVPLITVLFFLIAYTSLAAPKYYNYRHYTGLKGFTFINSGTPALIDGETHKPESSLCTPSVSITSSSPDVVCAGTSVTFSASASWQASPAAQYSWRINNAEVVNGSFSFFTTARLTNGDVVSCRVTDASPCDGQIQVTNSNEIIIKVRSTVKLEVTISASVNNICPGTLVHFTAVTFGAGDNPAYQWYLNGVETGTNNKIYSSSTLKNKDTIFCKVTKDPAYNCSAADAAESYKIVMQVIPRPPASVSINTNNSNSFVFCKGRAVTFTAAVPGSDEGYNYQWKVNGITTVNNSLEYTHDNPVNGDEITCVVSAPVNNCFNSIDVTDKIKLTVYDTASVVLSPADTIITAGAIVKLNATLSGNFSGYEWINAGALSDARSLTPVTNPVYESTTFLLQVKTAQGCITEKTSAIRIPQPLFMPGAFTPNGDGFNDLFRVPPGIDFTLHELAVYNRLGNLIFTTSNIQNGWNGKYKGKDAAPGLYIYIIRGTGIYGRIFRKGKFILIR